MQHRVRPELVAAAANGQKRHELSGLYGLAVFERNEAAALPTAPPNTVVIQQAWESAGGTAQNGDRYFCQRLSVYVFGLLVVDECESGRSVTPNGSLSGSTALTGSPPKAASASRSRRRRNLMTRRDAKSLLTKATCLRAECDIHTCRVRGRR